MSDYDIILNQFKKQGLYETNQVSFNEVKRALDSISAEKTGNFQFNFQIAQQIWNQTADQLSGAPPTLGDYIRTMLQAEQILKEQVATTQQKIKSQTNEERRQQLLSDLFSFSQDHRMITAPFGIAQLRQSKQMQESKKFSKGPRDSNVRYSRSVLFTDVPDEREYSTDLKITLYLSILIMIIEFINLFHKHHFFNLLCISLIVSIYVLKYFEKKYIVVNLAALGISCVLDIVWLVLSASSYWNPPAETHHSTIQTPFLRFIVFMTCISIIGRLVVIGLLFKYRAVNENVKKKVDLCGATFLMDARADPHNLLLSVMKPQNEKLNPFQQ